MYVCPFFTKSRLLEDYCTVLLYRVKQTYKDLPPFCEHVKIATLFLSRTKANFNRPFFKCANSIDHDPCSYFQWADQDPNEFTLALNHPRSRYFSQKPPSPEAKLKKKDPRENWLEQRENEARRASVASRLLLFTTQTQPQSLKIANTSENSTIQMRFLLPKTIFPALLY